MTKRPSNDRRTGRRYEVLGELLGTFEVQQQATTTSAAPASALRYGVRVHIVDIGSGGVLMAGSQAPAPGDTGTLTVLLTSGAFVTQVEVLHQRSGDAAGGSRRAGGAFRDMSESSRRRLELFLKAAKT